MASRREDPRPAVALADPSRYPKTAVIQALHLPLRRQKRDKGFQLTLGQHHGNAKTRRHGARKEAPATRRRLQHNASPWLQHTLGGLAQEGKKPPPQNTGVAAVGAGGLGTLPTRREASDKTRRLCMKGLPAPTWEGASWPGAAVRHFPTLVSACWLLLFRNGPGSSPRASQEFLGLPVGPSGCFLTSLHGGTVLFFFNLHMFYEFFSSEICTDEAT